jgi:RND family efflux transporter MFP subunit
MPLPTPESTENEIAVLVAPAEEATLSSQMPGKIKRISVGLGASFRKGAVLVEFDCSEQEAQLQTVQAELLGARETHLAKLRLQALGAAGELEVTVAAAAAERAKSQISLREVQLAYCKVLAPYAGLVAKLKVKSSESVALGQPLLDIVNPALLKAQFYVPAAWFSWIKPGLPFKVRMGDDGKTYSVRVSKLNARVEAVNQSLEVEGRFEGKTQGLWPGMVGMAVFPARSDKP